MTSGMSARVRAPNEPVMRKPRRTSRVISTGAAVFPAAMPIATMRPPSRMISKACANVFRDIGGRCIDRVCCAELPRHVEAIAPYIDGDDLRGAERARHLNQAQPDSSDGNDRDGLSPAKVRRMAHGAVGREHRTTEDSGLQQRQLIGQREHIGRRDDGVFGEPGH